MKINSVLSNNHHLKKNGYKMLRKLRKMKKRKCANKIYSLTGFEDTYFFVLYCKALCEIIEKEYPEKLTFKDKCDSFLSYLESTAKKKQRINMHILKGFLTSYTKFFNKIILEKHHFYFDQEITDLWNNKCIMAYIATWKTIRL